MTIPTSPVRLGADIQVEFGGTSPASLSEYYRGGANVPSTQADAGFGLIATSGPISMGTFRNQQKYFVFNDTIASNLLTGYDLTDRATTAGWNGTDLLNATVTVNAGVYVTNPSGAAMTDGGAPVGSLIAVINNGNIVGYGGGGGVGGSVSGASVTPGTSGVSGQSTLDFGVAVTVTNNGMIGGGGGGGGGGGAARHNPGKNMYGASGGGGGGGRANATGGAAGSSTGNDVNGVASPGAAGTLTTAGAGGARYTVFSVIGSGPGGAGGDLGLPGFPGSPHDDDFDNGGQSAPGAGGSAGLINVGGAQVSWIRYGLLYGGLNHPGTYLSGGYSNFDLGFVNNRARPTPRNGAWTAAMGNTWYWNTYTGSSSSAATTMTFWMAYENTTGSSFSGHLFGATDDTLTSITLNGASVTPGTTMPSSTTSASNSFTLIPGLNLIAIGVNNAATGPAGFAVRLRRTSDNATLNDIDRWYY